MTAKIPHQEGESAANDETGSKPRTRESHEWWRLSTGQDARELAVRLVARVDEIRKTDTLAARRGVDITQHAINIADDELLGDELNPRDLLKIYDAQMELLTAELRGAGVPEARDEAIERRKRALRIRTNYEFFVTEDLEGPETYMQRWACLVARAVPAER